MVICSEKSDSCSSVYSLMLYYHLAQWLLSFGCGRCTESISARVVIDGSLLLDRIGRGPHETADVEEIEWVGNKYNRRINENYTQIMIQDDHV